MLRKTSKQYLGMSSDCFKDLQNDPLLNSALLEGLGEGLVTLIKQYELNWPTTRTNKLAILANQLFKIIQKKLKNKAASIMSLQV